MSIIDIAKDLEYFSEKDLVEELQNPSGSYPRYIVLSELEGRKKINQAFRAREAAMTQPQTKLADETVQQTMWIDKKKRAWRRRRRRRRRRPILEPG